MNSSDLRQMIAAAETSNSGRVEFSVDHLHVKNMIVGQAVVIISPWSDKQFRGIDFVGRIQKDHPNHLGGLAYLSSGRKVTGHGSIMGTPYDYVATPKPEK